MLLDGEIALSSEVGQGGTVVHLPRPGPGRSASGRTGYSPAGASSASVCRIVGLDVAGRDLAQGRHHFLVLLGLHQRARARLDLLGADRGHLHQVEAIRNALDAVLDRDACHAVASSASDGCADAAVPAGCWTLRRTVRKKETPAGRSRPGSETFPEEGLAASARLLLAASLLATALLLATGLLAPPSSTPSFELPCLGHPPVMAPRRGVAFLRSSPTVGERRAPVPCLATSRELSLRVVLWPPIGCRKPRLEGNCRFVTVPPQSAALEPLLRLRPNTVFRTRQVENGKKIKTMRAKLRAERALSPRNATAQQPEAPKRAADERARGALRATRTRESCLAVAARAAASGGGSQAARRVSASVALALQELLSCACASSCGAS